MKGAVASVARGIVAATVALGLTACGGPEPVYRWREGAPAVGEVVVREHLLPHRSGREVRVRFGGSASAGSAIDLTILGVRRERTADGRRLGGLVDTDATGATPADRSDEDEATARVAEALVGRSVRLEFDAADGLRAVVGMTAALAAAGASDLAAAEQRDGLIGLLSDEALLRSLRGAGLAAVPADFRDRAAPLVRDVDVAVPGRGVLRCRLRGTAGFESDGSPVVRHAGGPVDGAETAGDPGPAVPDEIGAAVVERIEVEAETLHELRSRVPLRGRVTVRTPFARGSELTTTTSFTLSVEP